MSDDFRDNDFTRNRISGQGFIAIQNAAVGISRLSRFCGSCLGLFLTGTLVLPQRVRTSLRSSPSLLAANLTCSKPCPLRASEALFETKPSHPQKSTFVRNTTSYIYDKFSRANFMDLLERTLEFFRHKCSRIYAERKDARQGIVVTESEA